MNIPNIDDRQSKLPPGMADQNIQSWQRMVAFFDRHSQYAGWEFLKPMKELVNKLAESEQARFFRAGQSLYYLMISTADKHGLEDGQPYVAVILEQSGPWKIQSGFSYGKVLDQRTVEIGEDIFTALLPFLDWLWDSTRGAI